MFAGFKAMRSAGVVTKRPKQEGARATTSSSYPEVSDAFSNSNDTARAFATQTRAARNRAGRIVGHDAESEQHIQEIQARG
jgi:hypothetical protein